MNRLNHFLIVVFFVVAALLTMNSGGQTSQPATQPAHSPVAADKFKAGVDLAPLETIAVHTSGRVKSFESFARSIMQEISGGRLINDQSPVFTYLDLMLHPDHYENEPLIYIKMKLMRVQIADGLYQSGDIPADARGRIIKSGLIAPNLMSLQPVRVLLAKWSSDLVRTAKKVEAIESAMTLSNPMVLGNILKSVPPVGVGSEAKAEDQPWRTMDELANASSMGGANAASEQAALQAWNELTQGWSNHDPEQVNAAAVSLANALGSVNPELYPATNRLEWERWYFKNSNMTWVWLIYALSAIFLIFHIVFHWKASHWLGMSVFLIAFGFHTFAVGLRWYVAGRWPNSNMFEAVTTAAWFGGCFAVLLEPFVRKMPVRGLVALGSAMASMTALMAVHFLPLTLSAGIGNMMPVLNDVWLYIHTNVIIFSYCLIFMAAISAGLYLIYRTSLWLRDIEGRTTHFARVGGAGSVIMTRPTGGSFLEGEKTSFGQVLDGVTMILMELSFVLLWTGIVMGAIWADHSWGRPWGWDPKEVFALNTFLIFAVLVHTRIKVKDKGLWTAFLAVIGCAVMLFNWIIINFTISGLHSYA